MRYSLNLHLKKKTALLCVYVFTDRFKSCVGCSGRKKWSEKTLSISKANVKLRRFRWCVRPVFPLCYPVNTEPFVLLLYINGSYNEGRARSVWLLNSQDLFGQQQFTIWGNLMLHLSSYELQRTSWHIILETPVSIYSQHCSVTCFISCIRPGLFALAVLLLSLVVVGSYLRQWGVHVSGSTWASWALAVAEGWRRTLWASLVWPLASAVFCPVSWHWWKFMLGAEGHEGGKIQHLEGLENRSTANAEVLQYITSKTPSDWNWLWKDKNLK